MQVVFDTKTLAPAKRRQAWRDAICEIYLQVDCAAEQQDDYDGFVREMRFGDVTLTDTLLSPQSVRRQSQHIAHFDKDYYYAGIEQIGRFEILQGGSSFVLRPGIGGLYYANEPYVLRCKRQVAPVLDRTAARGVQQTLRVLGGRRCSRLSISAAAWAASPPNSAPSLAAEGAETRSAHQSATRRAVYGHPRHGY